MAVAERAVVTAVEVMKVAMVAAVRVVEMAAAARRAVRARVAAMVAQATVGAKGVAAAAVTEGRQCHRSIWRSHKTVLLLQIAPAAPASNYIGR